MKDSLGRFGEAWARGYLARNGFRILDTNVRCRLGELDIVAQEKDEIVFVEVKCRCSSRFGTPEEAVGRAKQERLARAVATYVQDSPSEIEAYRLDVVAIEVDSRGRVSRAEHIRGVELDV